MRVLHLERDLEVVAGGGLVEGRRGELRVLATRQVVAVGVVDAGARPVRGRREVVGERGVLLLVLLDGADVAARLREHPEVARRRRHRPLDVLVGPGDELGLGVRGVGGVGVEGRPIGRGVVAEPGLAGDLAALRLDALELGEADVVDVLRIEVERRPAADRRAVDGVAVGRRPDAGVLAGRREVRAAQRLEELEVGRIDVLPDRVADLLAVRLGRDLDHRGDDRLLDRHRQHPLDLGDRPLGHDARRGQPRGEAVAQDVGVRGHELGIGVESLEEGLEPLGRVGRLELGQLRQELLRPAHLVDDAQLVEALVVLLDAQLGDDDEHVAGDPLLGGQAVDRDRPCLGGGRGPGGRAPWRDRPGSGPRGGRRSGRRRRTWRSSD